LHLIASVGASGALFGLLGCILIDLLQNWRIILHPWRSLFGIIFTMVISFIIGLFPGIDNFSHIGGFISGCLAAVVFLPTIHFGKWDKRWKILARIVCAALIILMFVGLLIAFYNGNAGEWCSWCKYFGCLPIGNLCDAFNK
jgi:membrane associated rhomboid family serine protease